MEKIKVGILGATGMVGQRFVQLLEHHPWFEIVALAASDTSAGKTYTTACRWRLESEMPAAVRQMVVEPCDPRAGALAECELVFSALPADQARTVEPAFAQAGKAVSSNASAFRMEADVPLVIPEVNPNHLGLISVQRQQRGWPGFIVTNGNCSSIAFTLALKPLQDAFGLKQVFVVTMQAVSGAGYPGVSSWDIVDNVIPYIGGEEEKCEREPLKFLGRFDGQVIRPAAIQISAVCNRVPTLDGHLEVLSVEFERKATLEEIEEVLEKFRGEPQELKLPSAPAHPIIVRREVDRPQPRFDRDAERGMASVVGRIRPCPILDFKFHVLGHNTLRGAAAGALLNAELLVAKGFLPSLGWPKGGISAPVEIAVGAAATARPLSLDRATYQAIIDQAKAGAPAEICGILGGTPNGELRRVYPARNSHPNPIVTYAMDPKEQLHILRDLDDNGWELLAIYHSHPASPAYPSPTDVRQAFYPEAIYAILSLAHPARPQLRAFNIIEGQISEVPVLVDSQKVPDGALML